MNSLKAIKVDISSKYRLLFISINIFNIRGWIMKPRFVLCGGITLDIIAVDITKTCCPGRTNNLPSLNSDMSPII